MGGKIIKHLINNFKYWLNVEMIYFEYMDILGKYVINSMFSSFFLMLLLEN
jgi:hypothetical protein